MARLCFGGVQGVLVAQQLIKPILYIRNTILYKK